MFTDLFSSLDGNISIYFWLLSVMFILLISFNSSFTMKTSSALMSPIATLWTSMRFSSFKSFNLILLSTMTYLILNNLIGLTPFSYGNTSSLWFNGSLAIIMWGTLLMSGWFLSPMASAAHLCPSGSPMFLIPLLVIIESLSIIIRPITLTVRLVANISAGHIIMSLLSNVLSSSLSLVNLTGLYLLMTGYFLFEFFVCLIQAYIFTLLISLYASEHP